ncbi:hypothetical protein [Piscinibacter sp. HJYY11]|uniref:hypothetical protein n=1 Tax=Piscinibacter sp. HJYY11 TaxID=2801333 RepID=UPI00191F133E|nr:hypothetical protein [Piscinibacter sp. HJYY11]MBL0730392.1 hypothetical protein [Piscinibacter sp. HJYY11]
MSLLISSPLARDAIRLLACWVAVILLVQAMASALGRVQGPRHLHMQAEAVATVHEHRHDDGGWERHVHLSSIPGATLYDEAQQLGATAGAVLSAMVAIGASSHDVAAADAGHVMCACAAWSCITHTAGLPERPPRA